MAPRALCSVVIYFFRKVKFHEGKLLSFASESNLNYFSFLLLHATRLWSPFIVYSRAALHLGHQTLFINTQADGTKRFEIQLGVVAIVIIKVATIPAASCLSANWELMRRASARDSSVRSLLPFRVKELLRISLFAQ